MCPSPSGWRCLMQWSPLLYYSVWWPCHLHNGNCSGWTAHRGVCWDQSLAGLATVQKTGVPTCGEWMKNWKQLWNFIQCNFGTNKWPILAASWGPLDDWKLNFVTKPRRRRGRPNCRWDDRLSNFVECGLKSSWPEAAKRRQQWVAEEQFFLNFCRSQWWISRYPMSF